MQEAVKEMAEIISVAKEPIPYFNGKVHLDLAKTAYDIAEALYTAGYRRASDVAEEIFSEIGELVNEYLDGRSYRHEFLTKIAELKKKYSATDTNVGGNTEET